MRVKFLIRQRLSRGISSHFVEISRSRCLIGRGHADIGLSEGKCSRQHAVVTVHRSGELSIRDLNSTNGTILNGRRLRRESGLGVGDEIRIGDSVVSLVEVIHDEDHVIDGRWHDWRTDSRAGLTVIGDDSDRDEESWRKAA